jgi:hypothetical protein
MQERTLCAMLLLARAKACSPSRIVIPTKIASAPIVIPAKAGIASALLHSGIRAKSFHPPSEGEALLFCLSKREVPKRKRHPAWRLPGIGQPLLRCLNSGIVHGGEAEVDNLRSDCP